MSKQVNNKYANEHTKLVRIDKGWHKLLKLQATDRGVSIGNVIVEVLSESFDIEKFKEIQKKI